MQKRKIRIALAGNANVGKSVIFNYLTGLHQHIGNWPGKTVEKAEGTLFYKGYEIDVIDLPGIYSLSTFSIEEIISREYIATQKPDLVINVVDASVLERNLFFTLQLLELEVPMIMALNQIDVAKRKGILIDYKKLEKILGIPVVPTVAIKGIGIHKLLDEVIKVFEKRRKIKPFIPLYGKEVEIRIKKLTRLTRKIPSPYPPRWIAIKLLEGDEEVRKMVYKANASAVALAKKLCKEIEKIHGHSCFTVIASERYHIINKIIKEVQRIKIPEKPLLTERLDDITAHRILGYPIMILILFLVFFSVFKFGDFFSEILDNFFEVERQTFGTFFGAGKVSKIIWEGIFEGIFAGITIVLPYVIPFYIILGLLEDSGYLTRIAFLMDSLMHKIGLHGKAFIPIMLGYGCNVPACLGCRIMETEKEKLLLTFVVTLVPCAARTVIILGLVGRFVGFGWALALYFLDLLIIFSLGRIVFKLIPGESIGLIMEMHEYRLPHLKTVLKQAWFRVLEFIKIAFPLIIVSTLVIKVIEAVGILGQISRMLSPITVNWLGLPSVVGITLIFGILRKELMLLTLSTLFSTTDFSTILTPTQMIVFALVSMLYIPCIATITALIKEIGLKRAFLITAFEIAFAIFIGGIALRVLSLIY
jgi:ferrous iron transport protein B